MAKPFAALGLAAALAFFLRQKAKRGTPDGKNETNGGDPASHPVKGGRVPVVPLGFAIVGSAVFFGTKSVLKRRGYTPENDQNPENLSGAINASKETGSDVESVSPSGPESASSEEVQEGVEGGRDGALQVNVDEGGGGIEGWADSSELERDGENFSHSPLESIEEEEDTEDEEEAEKEGSEGEGPLHLVPLSLSVEEKRTTEEEEEVEGVEGREEDGEKGEE